MTFLLELVSRPMQDEGHFVQSRAAAQGKIVARIVSFEPIEHVHSLVCPRKTNERHTLLGAFGSPVPTGISSGTFEYRPMAPTKWQTTAAMAQILRFVF